ncbi:hypothetical protein JTB14_018600 [Gonioctena quinquepunctata]|nr:hypothetical protein JTB14_018600 [Gonioctena quinquepunctata]
MRLEYLIVVLGISSAFAAPSSVSSPLEERKKAVVQPTPGPIDLLQQFINLLTTFLSILEGKATVNDLVSSIQKLFFTIEKMVNIQYMVSFIPFVGPILAPMVGGFGTLLEDSGMLGGLLSQVLVGPTYPKSITPPPPPPKSGGGGLFGGWF